MPTIPIIYGGGCYGTFIEWCLNYFSGNTKSTPFNSNGNSHKFLGNQVFNIAGWREYLRHDLRYHLVRLHPKTLESESLIENLNEVLDSVDQAILLYADRQSLLLNLNNKFNKVWVEGWLAHTEDSFQKNLIAWGGGTLSTMETWEVREFLSLYMMPQYLAETEFNNILTYQNPKLFKIEIRDLFDNFECTIRRLMSYCELPVVTKDFDTIYSQWAPLQVHSQKDVVVDNIVNAIIAGTEYDWGEGKLSLIDESIVQMRLRDLHKLGLKCYNLNVFPTNTTDLKKLLFNAQPI
jgi:hypothetical protein